MNQPPALLNSITDATTSARGRVVVSGSHGGLFPAAIASRAGVHAVIFNDAGIGFEQAGVAGVKALETSGMAAAAVDCQSAEIGAADDMLAHGVISYANQQAGGAGVMVGMAVQQAAGLMALASAPHAQLEQVPEARWDADFPGQASALLCVW